MATQCFLRDAVPSTHTGHNYAKLNGVRDGWRPRALSTSRGAAATSEASNTVDGTTLGIEVGSITDPFEWISGPLDQDVTISGSITLNLRAAESSMQANVAINAIIERLDSLGAVVSTIAQTARTTELGTSEAAANFTVTPTSTAMLKGDRIRVRVYGDEVGTMASGHTFTFWWDGPTGGASGDSYVTFTETFGFLTTTPAGSTRYLRANETLELVEPVSESATPAVAENVDRAGANAWVNPTNAIVSDDARADGDRTTVGTDYLRLRDLGLAIPADTVIRGLQVSVEIRVSSGSAAASIATLQLQDDATLLIGASRNATGPSIGTSDVTVTAGGAGDNWGVDLTPALLNHPDFGVRIWFGSAAQSVHIDSVTFTIWTAPVGSERSLTVAAGGAAVTIENEPQTGWWPLRHLRTAFLGEPLDWFTPPLRAFTLADLVLVNVWAREGHADINATFGAEIAVVDADGRNPVVWGRVRSVAEPGTASTLHSLLVAGDDLAVADGKRIRLRLFFDDSPSAPMNMIALDGVYVITDGPTGGASGDSFLTLTQTVEEYTRPRPDRVLDARLLAHRPGPMPWGPPG